MWVKRKDLSNPNGISDPGKRHLFKPRSRLLSAILVLIMAAAFFANPAPASASNWYPELEYDLSRFGFKLTEPMPVGFSRFSRSLYEKGKPLSEDTRLGSYDCPELGTYPCVASPTTFLTGQLVAPVCEGSETNCIREFFAKTVSGTVKGQFVEYLQSVQFPAQPSLGLRGRGVSLSLWDLPGVPHAGGATTYAVSVAYTVNWQDGLFNTQDFQTSIVPYVQEFGPLFRDMVPHPHIDPDGKPRIGYGAAGQGCAWFRNGSCGRVAKFPEDVKFGLILKFDKDLATWFQARLDNTELKVRSASARDNIIEVTGSPTEVPIFSYSLDYATLPSEIRKQISKFRLHYVPGIHGTNSDSPMATALVKAYRKHVGDTAAGSLSVWTFSNIPSGFLGPCFSRSSDVLGMVTTNSMTYQGEPPVFRNGFLEYEVAGMHYLAGGDELALGTYELTVRSSVARCLYNLPNVPLSATVAVVNEKGKKVLATTTVGEKNGWLKLSAKGFTFSKKTIKVKITKAKR
jgi:hypothetical protein